MKVIYRFLLILYLIVGTIPNLESLDKVVTQWFYLNTLNTISLLFLLIKGYPLKSFFYNRVTILFFFLFIWSSLTVFFAINKIESVVVLSQLFAIVTGFIIISVCISEINKPFDFISNVISIYLILELTAIYMPFLNFDNARAQIFNRSSLFLGFAANVNITAFSILYKIPFFLYSVLQLKKFKITSIFIAFIIFTSIVFASGTLNSTRGAILTYTSLVPILIIISSVVYFKSKKLRLLIITLTYSLSVLFSFSFNSYLSNTLGRGESNITNRISTLKSLGSGENEDQSLNQRKNFYSQAATYIMSNPFFGTGIGNWKIKSIDLDKENITGYTVPYHVHNDYLEIGSEIGLVGLGIYVFILIISFYKTLANFFKILFTRIKLNKNYLKWTSISLFIYIFLIDSNINFPFHRPIVLINLIVLIAYLNLNNKKVSNEK